MDAGGDERLAVRVGEEVAVTLEENRTTGYSWRLEIPAALLEMIGEEHSRSSDRAGAGGTVTFRFRASAPGEGRLVAIYERPWEHEPVRRHDWRIVVAR